jgi:multidrug efflux pump subunit AcrB
VADVQDALKRENIELPGGEIRNNTMTMAVQMHGSITVRKIFAPCR